MFFAGHGRRVEAERPTVRKAQTKVKLKNVEVASLLARIVEMDLDVEVGMDGLIRALDWIRLEFGLR